MRSGGGWSFRTREPANAGSPEGRFARKKVGAYAFVMHAEAPGHSPAVGENESPAQALVRLLEQHGLEGSLREILAAVEAQKQERQQRARFELLEQLLEGQPPLTAEEIEAAEREWAELQSTPVR